MDLGIEGRSAMVVGSTSGLGLAIAHELAAEGARVAFCGRRFEVAQEQASRHRSAIGVALDLGDPASVEDAVLQVSNAFDAIDILVLNGGGPPPGQASTLIADDLNPALRNLLIAQIQLVSLVLPQMRHSGWGRIVAVGSSGIQQPIGHLVQSNAARSALAAYLKTLATEVAAEGITVNTVVPGRIDTARIAILDSKAAERQGVDPATARRRSESGLPMQRYGIPEEFAAVAAFLCSARASYVSGSQVRVDGGSISAL
jgi:3-oxoacyl-[acyl-carrier protein] reductase